MRHLALAALLLAILLHPEMALAQQCIGTNVGQLNATFANLKHIDKSNESFKGLELYYPNETNFTAAVDYLNDDGKKGFLKNQAHHVLAAKPSGDATHMVLELYVFPAPERKHMCPDVNVTDEHTKTEAAKAFNLMKEEQQNAGAKRDAIQLFLTGNGPKRQPLGILRMTEKTPGAKLTFTIPKAMFDRVNKTPDPQLTGNYNLAVEWWGVTEAQGTANNAKSHWTGVEKGEESFSKRPPLLANELAGYQNPPKSSWHGGGELSKIGLYSGVRATLVQNHAAILRLQDELSTTLEGESEYELTQQQYQAATAVFKRLTGEKTLGFEVEADGQGTTEDTYYDFDDYTLLKHKILLRRRVVPAKDNGKDLFLFSVKAANESKDGLMVRLSSQFKLSEAKVGNNLAALTQLVLDDHWNPFSQIIVHGLGGVNLQTLKTKTLQAVFVVHSTRQKFVIKNIHEKPGQTIEVTIDEAYAQHLQKKSPTVYSLEFGIEHPGATVVAGVGDVREHHIPSDLRDAVFERPDVASYKQVRNAVLNDHYNKDPSASGHQLTAIQNSGGFKAWGLAKKLGLID